MNLKTRFLMWRIIFLTNLARLVPISWSGSVENFAQACLSRANTASPMSIDSLALGQPWLGRAVCQDINCRNEWTCFLPNGADPDIELECPACEQPAGVLV